MKNIYKERTEKMRGVKYYGRTSVLKYTNKQETKIKNKCFINSLINKITSSLLVMCAIAVRTIRLKQCRTMVHGALESSQLITPAN